MGYATTDLCDAFSDNLQIADPVFFDFGSTTQFSGPITTLKLHEDNSLVREALETDGQGGVLVVDGGGSTRCALLGGNLAVLAEKNNWSGVVVYGCIRDRDEIEATSVGVKALAPHPLKSHKQGIGQRDIPVRFAGVQWVPGHYLYADKDGMVLSEKALNL
ncbi:MAG: ribonuclease E activity regulator RraA [Nevskiales bacterium]